MAPLRSTYELCEPHYGVPMLDVLEQKHVISVAYCLEPWIKHQILGRQADIPSRIAFVYTAQHCPRIHIPPIGRTCRGP